jgi:hypothetical protein
MGPKLDSGEQATHLGQPSKSSDEFLAKLNALCFRDVRSSSVNIAAILSRSPSQESLGHH